MKISVTVDAHRKVNVQSIEGGSVCGLNVDTIEYELTEEFDLAYKYAFLAIGENVQPVELDALRGSFTMPPMSSGTMRIAFRAFDLDADGTKQHEVITERMARGIRIERHGKHSFGAMEPEANDVLAKMVQAAIDAEAAKVAAEAATTASIEQTNAAKAAEEQRETAFSASMSQWNREVVDAISDTQQAKDAADQATDAAIMAADEAHTAASSARGAAAEATVKATAAQNAANAANASKASADQAAANAQAKATLADQNAAKADQAANDANESKANADAATKAANDAAQDYEQNVRAEVDSKAVLVQLYCDHNAIYDHEGGNVLTFNQVQELISKPTNYVSINVDNVYTAKSAAHFGDAIEFIGFGVIDGLMWFNRVIINEQNQVKEEELNPADYWKVEELKSRVGTIADDVEHVKGAAFNVSEKSVVPTFVENYYVWARPGTGNSGKFFYDATWERTDYTDCSGASKLLVTMQTLASSDAKGIAFYDDKKTYISGIGIAGGGDGSLVETEIEVPSGAAYFVTCFKKNLESQFSAKLVVLEGAASIAIAETARAKSEEQRIESKIEDKIRPLIIELAADYNWVSSNEVSAFSSDNPKFTEDGQKNNAYFKITGNAGDDYVTVVSGGNADISDLGGNHGWWGGVIGWGDGSYDAANVKYRDDSTLTVYPPLKQAITDGELGNMKTGIHLSRRGYIGYAQAAYRANPKWCEKTEKQAQFDAVRDGKSGLVKFGDTSYLGASKLNLGSDFMSHYSVDRAYLLFNAASYTPHTTTTGITWTVELDQAKSGYLELFIGGVNDKYIDYPDGQEIHVEMWIDGVLSDFYVKKNQVCERICFDYAGASIGTVKVYSNKWQGVDGFDYGFSISRMTWWVNNTDFTKYGNKMFRRFETVSQMFDSWGVFHDGASGKELKRLLSVDAGVTVAYENHSKGSQTSAWGKAWFYENVEKYKPKTMIIDFLINDTNSMFTTGWPETVDGPDGTKYNNVIEDSDYLRNMTDLCDMAIANDIQPIIFGYCLHGEVYNRKALYLVDNIGEVAEL